MRLKLLHCSGLKAASAVCPAPHPSYTHSTSPFFKAELDQPLLQSRTQPTHWIKVAPGDTVSQLIAPYYDTQYGTKTYKLALAQLKRHNPEVRNIDHIRVGQGLRLMPLPEPEVIDRISLPVGFSPWAVSPTPTPGYANQGCLGVSCHIQHVADMAPLAPSELELFQALSWFETS